MNGFIPMKQLAAGVLLGLTMLSGCTAYRNIVDPCWPERYWAESRKNVVGAITPQVVNGHVLEQTVWNYHFEAGTDKLTPGGIAHLNYLARRRPAPDTMVYVQTARDIVEKYDPAKPEAYSQARTELDTQRTEAVRKYLHAYTGGRGLHFEVAVHDPGDVGASANFMARPVQLRDGSAAGALPTSAGVVGGGGQ